MQPLSSVTRHTCCFYPEPHPLAEGSGARAYTSGVNVPRVLEGIDVLVQLESTGEAVCGCGCLDQSASMQLVAGICFEQCSKQAHHMNPAPMCPAGKMPKQSKGVCSRQTYADSAAVFLC